MRHRFIPPAATAALKSIMERFYFGQCIRMCFGLSPSQLDILENLVADEKSSQNNICEKVQFDLASVLKAFIQLLLNWKHIVTFQGLSEISLDEQELDLICIIQQRFVWNETPQTFYNQIKRNFNYDRLKMPNFSQFEFESCFIHPVPHIHRKHMLVAWPESISL